MAGYVWLWTIGIFYSVVVADAYRMVAAQMLCRPCLQVTRGASVALKVEMCDFCKSVVEVIGHCRKSGCRETDPGKI